MTDDRRLRLQLDGIRREIRLTADQARDLADGHAIAWYAPDVPERITVDADGVITEHEDARPRCAN